MNDPITIETEQKLYGPIQKNVPLWAAALGVIIILIAILILAYWTQYKYFPDKQGRIVDWRTSYSVVALIINSISGLVGSGGSIFLAVGLLVYTPFSLFVSDDTIWRKITVNAIWLFLFVVNGAVIFEVMGWYVDTQINLVGHLIVYGVHPAMGLPYLPTEAFLILGGIADWFIVDIYYLSNKSWVDSHTCYLFNGCAQKIVLSKKKITEKLQEKLKHLLVKATPPCIPVTKPTVSTQPNVQQFAAVQQATTQVFEKVAAARADRVATTPVLMKPPDPKNPLLVTIGDQNGKPLIIEIRHMSIAGASEMGKTTFIWRIICDLILHDPRKVQLILACAKEFTSFKLFEHLPHVLMKVKENSSVEFTKIVNFVFEEYTRRFALFNELAVTNIFEYNQYCAENEQIPQIIVIIDEMSHLTGAIDADIVERFANSMLVLRAAGIYAMLGAQDPSANSLPLKIRGNLQIRIAVPCTPGKMSEIAIGRPGADKLNPDKLEAIMVSMRGNEGQAIKFTRPRISESLVWKYILQSEKMFGYDKKIKQELLEAIARRRNNSKSLPVADNVILLNNKQFHPIPPSHSAAQESNNSINSNSTPPQNVVQKGDTKDLNKFIEMISQGIPQSEIAEYFGFGSQGTVSKKLKQYLEKVEALVAKNVKVEEIAVQMNCSPKTVLKIYKMFKQKESQDAPNHQKVSSSHAMVVSQ